MHINYTMNIIMESMNMIRVDFAIVMMQLTILCTILCLSFLAMNLIIIVHMRSELGQ